MLIWQKDGDKVFAIADGTLFGNPHETETKNGKPCVRFTLQYDSSKGKDGKYDSRTVVCLCVSHATVEVARTLKSKEFVCVMGVRTVDQYMTERTGQTNYSIFCTTVLPTKRLMKSLAWIEESREYERKIYKDVLENDPFAITYDGDDDEPIDVDF